MRAKCVITRTLTIFLRCNRVVIIEFLKNTVLWGKNSYHFRFPREFRKLVVIPFGYWKLMFSMTCTTASPCKIVGADISCSLYIIPSQTSK